jgi:hypothetical protein
MGSVRYPETSIIKYQSTLHNIPEERRPVNDLGNGIAYSQKGINSYHLFILIQHAPNAVANPPFACTVDESVQQRSGQYTLWKDAAEF